jgi:uncharacterized protein YllA (UPF0747 family)
VPEPSFAVSLTISERPAAPANELTVLTEPIGGSPLSRAAQAGSLSPEWFPRRPQSPEEWSERVARVASEFSQRSWYDDLSPAIAATGRARERLERVVREGGTIVTTGQQPGLVGGTMLTLAKALSARALADAIERHTGKAAAPLFWAATDDADFDEASTIWFSGTRVREITIAERGAAGTPMATTRFGTEDLAMLRAALDEACGSSADSAAVDAARRAYREDATIGGAYVALLRELFEELEIAVLDSSHEAVRRVSRPFLDRALARASTVERALAERAREIRTNGFDPQVIEVEGLTLVFAHEQGIKRRIRVTETQPTHDFGEVPLSPTVLLRPVIERAILPTVAYVAGPAELAYFTQCSAVASALGLSAPVAVPRWSTTVIERRVARALAKLSASPHDLQHVDALATRLAAERLPDSIHSPLAQLRDSIQTTFAKLRSADPTPDIPERALIGAEQHLAARVDRLQRRYTASIKRADDALMRGVQSARDALYPGGVRQERTHAFLPYLARYGVSFTNAMLAAAAMHAEGILTGGAPSRGDDSSTHLGPG